MASLLCVDIQKAFSTEIKKWDEQKLQVFTKQFSGIFSIYDYACFNSDDVKPVYDFLHIEDNICYKSYDTFMYDILLESNYILQNSLINYKQYKTLEEKQQFLWDAVVKVPRSFYVINIFNYNQTSLVMSTESLHKFIEITYSLDIFMHRLEKEVTLIGGGWKECLHDIYSLCKYYKKDVSICQNFVY